MRQQTLEWQSWRPWAALIGVGLFAGYFLSEFVMMFDNGLVMQLSTYVKYGVRFEQGVSAAQDCFSMLWHLLALCVWSWSGGFAVACLSRRSAWLTGSCLYAVVITGLLHAFFIRQAGI